MQVNQTNGFGGTAAGADALDGGSGAAAFPSGHAAQAAQARDAGPWRDRGSRGTEPGQDAFKRREVAGEGLAERIDLWMQAKTNRAQARFLQRHAALNPADSSQLQGDGLLRALGTLRDAVQGTLVNRPGQAVEGGAVAGSPVLAQAAVPTSAPAGAAPSGAAGDAAALAQATAALQQRFAAKASDKAAFDEMLRQAFGDRFDAAKAEAIRQQSLAGDFSWTPKVQVVDSQALADLSGTQAAGAAQGAYVAETDTIYLSRELLRSDPAQAQRILMEELGHGIDARINTSDAVGDEGEIFSKLMHGDRISAQEMADLKADNDHGVVNIGGRSVAVEYGWFKKAVKAITGGIKKVAESAATVATGLATLNFDKVKEGLQDGADAVKDTAKELHKIAKETFVKLMQSKLFSIVLTVCYFIPVVQVVAYAVNMARAAYMVYQGIKNKSLSMVFSGVASMASAGCKFATAMGAANSTVAMIGNVATAASRASMAYNVIAKKDLTSAVGLLASFSGEGSDLKANAEFAQQALGVRDAVRSRDALGALGGALGLAGAKGDKEDSAWRGQLSIAQDVVAGARAVRAIDQGQLDQAQSIVAGMNYVGQVGKQTHAELAERRERSARQEEAAAQEEERSAAQASFRRAELEEQGSLAQTEPVDSDTTPMNGADPASGQAHDAASDPPARTETRRLVGRGDTLEQIARDQYGDNWRAGLAGIVIANGIKFNQWGSPILREGKTLELPDIGGKSEQELASLSRSAGRLIANNDKGLKAKFALEEQARADQRSAQTARDPYEAAIADSAKRSVMEGDPNYEVARNHGMLMDVLGSKDYRPQPESRLYPQYPQNVRDLIHTVDRIVLSDRPDIRPRDADPITPREVESAFSALKDLKEIQTRGSQRWTDDPRQSAWDVDKDNNRLKDHIQFKSTLLYDYAHRHGIQLSPQAAAMGRDDFNASVLKEAQGNHNAVPTPMAIKGAMSLEIDARGIPVATPANASVDGLANGAWARRQVLLGAENQAGKYINKDEVPPPQVPNGASQVGQMAAPGGGEASADRGIVARAGALLSDRWNGSKDFVESKAKWVADKAGELKKDFNQMQDQQRAEAEQRGGVMGALQKMNVVVNDVRAGVVMGAADFVGGTTKMAYGAAMLANPVEWAVNPDTNIGRAQATGQALAALGSVTSPGMWVVRPEENLAIAKNLAHGLTEGYREGNLAQGAGRFLFDAGSMLTGAGEARGLAKAGEKLGRMGEAAEAAGVGGRAAAREAAAAERAGSQAQDLGSAAGRGGGGEAAADAGAAAPRSLPPAGAPDVSRASPLESTLPKSIEPTPQGRVEWPTEQPGNMPLGAERPFPPGREVPRSPERSGKGVDSKVPGSGRPSTRGALEDARRAESRGRPGDSVDVTQSAGDGRSPPGVGGESPARVKPQSSEKNPVEPTESGRAPAPAAPKVPPESSGISDSPNVHAESSAGSIKASSGESSAAGKPQASEKISNESADNTSANAPDAPETLREPDPIVEPPAVPVDLSTRLRNESIKQEDLKKILIELEKLPAENPLKNYIEKGAFEGVDGYSYLVLQVKASKFHDSILQALKLGEQLKNDLSGILFFEKKAPEGAGAYDIDVGLKSAAGEITSAYQLKTVNGNKNIASNVNSAAEQLAHAPSSRKIINVDVKSGSYADFQASGREAGFLNNTAKYKGMEVNINFSDGVRKSWKF